jgi:uncharacterized membrane-anchored protein
MAVGGFVLLFLACGVVTFPLGLLGLRILATLSSTGRLARRLDRSFDDILTVLILTWLVGAFAFYAVALYFDRQKSCEERRTTMLSEECRKHSDLED